MDKVKIIVFSLLGLIILGLFILTIFTSKLNTRDEDNQSVDRTIQINRVMIATLGQKWGVTLSIILSLIFIIFGLLFYSTIQDKINITIDDHEAMVIHRIGLVGVIIFGIMMITFAIQIYVSEMPNTWVKNSIPHKQTEEDKTKKKIIVGIIGMLLMIIVLIAAVVWYIITHRKRQKSLASK